MKKTIKAIFSVSAAACFALPLASCGGADQLESPTGFSLDENYNLTWSPVANARSYLIEIKNVETGVSTEATSRRENIALSYLETGDYDIRVCAVGDGSHFYDSEWSAVVPISRAYESGCQYRLINNGSEYEIASAIASATDLVLEDSYRGKPVTSIGDSAFRRANALVTLELGKNITNIGEGAFYNCVSLQKIEFPDTVTTIGSSAFQACRSLESIELPAGVTELKDNTFAYCRGLTEIDLKNVTVIGNSVFDNCTGLETFTFPDGVVSIGERSFAATALEEITLGSGMTVIGKEAFSGCTALDTVNFSRNGNLKTIGDGAFQLTALTGLTLPNGLESIGTRAFYYASQMQTVDIPDSVTRIGYDAFFATKFYLDAFNAGDVLLYADDWLVDYHEGEGVTISNLYAENPDNLANTYCIEESTVGIADGAFMRNDNLMIVNLSKNVKYVGVSAFSRCSMLYRFNAAGSALVSLGAGALAFNEELRQIVFVDITNNSSDLKEIGDYAFYGCTLFDYSGGDAASRFLPPSVERIGTFAFKDTGLYKNTDHIKDGVIYADDWVVGHVVNDNGSSAVPSAIDLSGAKGISDYAFYNCTELRTVGDSSEVLRIGRGAFYNCSNLALFAMNNNVTRIEDYAFYGCESLIVGEESLPRDLRYIGRSAFYGCAQIQRINMRRSLRLESVGDFAFYGCVNLTSVNIGRSLTEIGNYTFYGCTQLASLTIPSNIKKVGDSAFSGCISLAEVVFEEGVEEIGDFAFRLNTALKEIDLPDSVKRVGNSAFLQCVNVRDIDLGSVEEIGDFAFAENFGVSSLVIPDSVKTIGKGAFYYLGAFAESGSVAALGSVRSVVIAGSPEKIEPNAFYGCNFATLYMESENKEVVWGIGWNSSRRPTVWGVTLSEDKSYVASVTVTENTFEYFDVLNILGGPWREGYSFAGWTLEKDGTEIAYTAQNVMNAPVGTTLYAVYIQD